MVGIEAGDWNKEYLNADAFLKTFFISTRLANPNREDVVILSATTPPGLQNRA
jgi:hypothetical protein